MSDNDTSGVFWSAVVQQVETNASGAFLALFLCWTAVKVVCHGELGSTGQFHQNIPFGVSSSFGAGSGSDA